MATLTTTLGKVMPVFKGEHNAVTEYLILDEVTKNGNYYRSKRNGNLNHAVSDQAWWLLISNEGDRQSAEGLRATAEQTRQGNETGRQTTEGLRVTAETARQTGEGLRVTAEQTRQTAEGLRQQAENKRQTNTAIAIQNAETATTNAENAAILAIEVAEHPNTIVNEYWWKWNTTTNAYENTGIKAKGDTGKSAYQIYYDTTTDNPKLTENQWGNLMTGILNVLNSI